MSGNDGNRFVKKWHIDVKNSMTHRGYTSMKNGTDRGNENAAVAATIGRQSFIMGNGERCSPLRKELTVSIFAQRLNDQQVLRHPS